MMCLVNNLGLVGWGSVNFPSIKHRTEQPAMPATVAKISLDNCYEGAGLAHNQMIISLRY